MPFSAGALIMSRSVLTSTQNLSLDKHKWVCSEQGHGCTGAAVVRESLKHC